MSSRKPRDEGFHEVYPEHADKEDKGDEYVTTAEVEYCHHTENGVLVEWRDPKTHRREQAWLPRRCIHHNIDRRINTMRYGEKFKVQCFRWVAVEKGLPI